MHQMDIYEVMDLIEKENTINIAHPPMAKWLLSVYDAMSQNADPEKPFFYLGGPMRNYPHFNFPRFNEVAGKLRAQGYNLVSPAELDDPVAMQQALASEDGQDKRIVDAAGTFLERDVVICAMPTCQGAIFLEGWERSDGAALESYVEDRLGKAVYTYEEDETGSPCITLIDRDTALSAARVSYAFNAVWESVLPTAEDEAFAELSLRNGYEGAR